MKTADLIELLSLLSSIIISVTGALTAIQRRRATDAEMGGSEVLGRAKVSQDIVLPSDQTEALRQELSRVQSELGALRKQQEGREGGS